MIVCPIAGADGELWLLLINRETVPLDVDVAGGLRPGDAPIYRFDGANRLAPAGTVAVAAAGTFTLELPAQSASLVVAEVETGFIFADGFESGDLSAW